MILLNALRTLVFLFAIMAKSWKRATKIQRDMLDSYPVPEDSEFIGKITGIKGQGNYEILYLQPSATSESHGLVSMPAKFKNTIWVKRGSFVIFSTYEPNSNDSSKIVGEIKHILSPKQISHIQTTCPGAWPSIFVIEKLDQDTDISSDSIDDLE
jgi:hypothetical protein